MRAFRILYEDESFLAVDKPAGFHSHPPEDKSIRIHPKWNGLSLLERQLDRKLYPAHRLDRATSGVFLLSKERGQNDGLQALFRERAVEKTYICLVRGSLQGASRINDPLKNEAGIEEEAITRVEELGHFILPIPGPSGESRRFTLVKAKPETGKYHQIRRHLARLGLPLVGDSRHGDKRVNRAFTEITGRDQLYLRCLAAKLRHPLTREELRIRAPFTAPWHELFDRAGLCPLL
jgi:tRNA pseudouridine65 synthase